LKPGIQWCRNLQFETHTTVEFWRLLQKDLVSI
jgi:hypothetical protein